MRDNTVKILVTGPFNTGKTTLVRTVSEGKFLSTEVPLTLSKEKNTTTVAFDFTKVRIKGKEIFLLGSPGQSRFSFMLDVLSQGVKAFIFLIDDKYIEDPQKIRKKLDELKRYGKPIVIGINMRGNKGLKKKISSDFIKDSPVVIFSAKDRFSSLKLISYTIDLIEKTKEKIRYF